MKYYSLETKATKQKKCTFITSEDGLLSDNVICAAYAENGTLYAGTDKGLCAIYDGKITAISDEKINCIYSDGIKIYAGTDTGFSVYENCKIVFNLLLNTSVDDICSDYSGNIWAATKNSLYKFLSGELKLFCNFETDKNKKIISSGEENIYASSEDEMYILHGKRRQWSTLNRELTNIPKTNIRTLATDSCGYIWLGCDDGVYIYDGHSEWINSDKLDVFPSCPINSISFDSEGSVYLATDIGLYIADASKTSFLGKGRYLLSDKVNDIAVKNDCSRIAAATDKGLSVIDFVYMTLEEKEKYFTSKMPLFCRENFYISKTSSSDGNKSGKVEISDNDGLWTAEYIAALCCKYVCTKDKEVRNTAAESVKALIKLQTVTGISGFPARAYRRPGEHNFGDGNKEWHESTDNSGPLEWKGETSSDELVGHYFAFSCFYDLAADEKEKSEIAGAVKSITDHILSNGYTLCDKDGVSTTWAHFGPEDLNDDDVWCWEKGLNSLELLSFLSVCAHVTEDKYYSDKISELVKKYHYAMNILTYKKYDRHTCHIDDRLGFFAVVPLLKYEKDKDLLKYVKLALRRHYEYERIENNPFFSFVYAGFTGSHADLDRAVETLENYPLDLNSYKMDYRGRPDLSIDYDTGEYGVVCQSFNALPADERASFNMMTNPFAVIHNRDDYILSPAEWLLSYWTGKYLGMI